MLYYFIRKLFGNYKLHNCFLGTAEEIPTEKRLCSADDECPNTLACLNSTCLSPCTSVSCGLNAFCEVDNHAAWCRCNPGYTKPEGGKCISGKHYKYKTLTFKFSYHLINVEVINDVYF